MIHLGGETNDRIDQVLAVMIKMNDKVDVLTGKVNGIEETVQTISHMEDEMAEHVAKLKIRSMMSSKKRVKTLGKSRNKLAISGHKLVISRHKLVISRNKLVMSRNKWRRWTVMSYNTTHGSSLVGDGMDHAMELSAKITPH